MSVLLDLVAAFLLLTLLVALLRIWVSAHAADRMLASQLFGTTGVALLLVLAEAQQLPALRDVALIVAVLSVLSIAAFVTRVVRIDHTGRETSGDPRE